MNTKTMNKHSFAAAVAAGVVDWRDQNKVRSPLAQRALCFPSVGKFRFAIARLQLPFFISALVLGGAQPFHLVQPTWLPAGIFSAIVLGTKANAVVVLASTDFTNWVPVVTNAPFIGNFPFTDTNASAFSRRFYRAQEAP